MRTWTGSICALIAGAGLLLLGVGEACGQITRAGAVGSLNPVPTAGGSGFRTFGGHGGRFIRQSRGFLGGGIGYRSHVNCGLVYGTSVSVCWHGTYPWWYCGRGCCGWNRSTYAGLPLWEVDRRVYPDAPMKVVPEPAVDAGVVALKGGRFTVARRIYLDRAQDRVEREAAGEVTGVDRSDLRLAGLAAGGERRFGEAERLLTDAYAEDASLWTEPLDGATLVGGKRVMRDIVNGAVAHAHRTGRAESWDVVAVLMQGEDRHDLAREMVARAERIRSSAEVEEALERGEVIVEEGVALAVEGDVKAEVAKGD